MIEDRMIEDKYYYFIYRCCYKRYLSYILYIYIDSYIKCYKRCKEVK